MIERVRAWARAHRSPSAPLIWIHAPSVGEGLMAKPIINRLRDERPDAQIAYTFFSPSAEAFAQSLGADVADYLPFDTADAARAMLDALTPAVIAFSKLDVWPLLAAEAAARRVKLVLTSGTVSEASARRSALASLLLRDAYAALDAVGAVHADDAARLVALGVRPDRVAITGDVRYDQVWERVSGGTPNADVVTRLWSERPTLVAGSTWPGDEACLFDGWPSVRGRFPRARLVVAPHEPSDATSRALEARGAQLGLSSARIDAATPDTDLVIVDRVGVLADLYALASVAHVGGGFHDAGLHSVVEPAAFGVPVLFGPRHAASRDAGALLKAGGGFTVASGGELAAAVTSLFEEPGRGPRARGAGSAAAGGASSVAAGAGEGGAAGGSAGEKARAVIAAGLGAADKSAALILPMLRPLRLSR